MSGAWAMGAVVAMAVGVLAWLVLALVRTIRVERSGERSTWREFGLGLVLMALFFASWAAQGVTQWQVYVDEQAARGQPAGIGDFAAEFGQATMENWQSEFLQLFSFVVLAGLYIHKGSAESKDGEEKLEASLRRIEEHLGTLPDDVPDAPGQGWKLPATPLRAADRPSG